MRCEQAYATYEGAGGKGGGGLFGVFVIYSLMFFLCLPREGFHLFLLQVVWGWTFRLAASRARATRCREPALVGADLRLSLVAFGR